MSREIWVAIDGYNGAYEVSNFGHIRSRCRKRLVKNRYGNTSYRTDRGKDIAPVDNGNGYLYVTLNANGKRKNHYIHRLVADAFCEKKQPDAVVNHKDRNRKNNHADNLEWCTQRENVLHSAPLMRRPKSKCKRTNTGEKYISFYLLDGKCPRYRLNIRQQNVYKVFFSLEQAVAYRNEVMSGDV